MSLLSKFFGGSGEKVDARTRSIVEQINDLEDSVKAFSADELKDKVSGYNKEHKNGKKLDDLLVPMFAITREAAKRSLNQRHYDVQLMGGIALHDGKIVEMRTGEGKTLSATLAVSLNALSGEGVHVITVNDYLAKRDAVWMGQVYRMLGFSVACVVHDNSYIYDPEFKGGTEEALDKERDKLGGFKVVEEFLRPCSRQEAYETDITYGTNNEFGFDWLRDNLEIKKESLRQRVHYFAIIDEVDSILIDEARTPLIISSPDSESEDLYKVFSKIVPSLKSGEHFEVDEKLKAATLNEDGIEKVEKMLGVKDIYTERGIRYVHHLEQALRAITFFKKDRDYVVKNGEIIIVDEFTGRLMPGRRWSEGLHQAIEAKEGLSVQKESRTLASITFQNYFRMYEKLSGMTGTAVTSREEFEKVYNLDVATIPTHKPMVRLDKSDSVYQTENGKWIAVVRKIKECNENGRPVLVGTISIQNNEKLSLMLKKEGIKHEVLNAKNHEREGEIIAQAGKYGVVTIATNMAGRGVDIILGGNPPSESEASKVKKSGGLFVLGTERHEARRIDNQLRGRSGRQGDPGETQFFVSFEDDLLRVFAPEKLKRLMGTFGIPEDEPIESKMVSRSIESAQSKIEGFHFDARKHLLEFDDVLSRQRFSLYKLRREMLLAEHPIIEDKIQEVAESFSSNAVDAHTHGDESQWTVGELADVFTSSTNREGLKEKLTQIHDVGELKKTVKEILLEEINKRKEKEKDHFYQTARLIYLQIIDYLWREHLEAMEYTKSSVNLRAYGQHDPLVEYKNEAIRLFRTFHQHLEDLFINNLLKAADQESHSHAGVLHRIAPPPPAAILAHGGNASKRVKVGRNESCPCGSGKKYKKCGDLNTEEHIKNMKNEG